MQIAICDDCAIDRHLLSGYLERFSAENATVFSVMQFDGAQALLDALRETAFDAVFLDIYMQGKSGMEAAKEIRARGCESAIVFTTSSADYAVEGYEVSAMYYLLKPYTYAQLSVAAQKLVAHSGKPPRVLEGTEGRMRWQVPLQEVLWIEAGDHCAYLHTAKQILRTGALLSQLCEEMADESCIIRSNRGVVVNADHVLHCDAEFIYLDNGERLQMNLRNSLKIRQEIHDYRWNRLRKLP